MLSIFIAFTILWLTTCFYAWWRGGWEGKTVAALLFSAALITPLAIWLAGEAVGKNVALLTVDTSLLAALGWVAFKTDRYWPLWLVGLHLIAVFAEAVAIIDGHRISREYEAVQQFWTVPMQIILAWGVWLDRQADCKALARAHDDSAASIERD